MEISDLLTGISLVVAAFALVLSVVVARLALSQSQSLHEATQDLSLETHAATRFDALFSANDQLLDCLADFKADLLPYWKEQEWLDELLASHELVEKEVAVHRSLEHFFARRKTLEMALIGLPSPETVAEGLSDTEAMAKLRAAVEQSKVAIRYEAAWLHGCAMTVYHALVGRSISREATEFETDNVVFGKIGNEMDWDAFETRDVRLQFTKVKGDSWVEMRKEQAADTRKRNARLKAEGKEIPELVADDPAQISYKFLERAEASYVSATADLARIYAEARESSADAERSRRKARFWLSA